MNRIKEVVETIMENNFSFDKNTPILIVADDSTGELANHFYQALQGLDRKAHYVQMTDRIKSGEEPDTAIAKAMTEFPLVFCLTKHSLTHTSARREANERGISVITMPGITRDMFLFGAINADYSIVEKETIEKADELTIHETVTVRTGESDELIIPIGDREGIASTGVFHKLGDSGNLPSGEAFIAPIEYEAEGTIEINGSIAGIGLVHKPITLKITKGRLEEATGEQGKELLELLGTGDGRFLAELGIGTNYAARITGNILEDEKAYDTIHVAFGSNDTFGGIINTDVHIDCVTKSPKIIWGDLVTE